ncbi:MAG TPA: hypothetical protein VFN42_07735 [Acetobacteraceae bacterium]|nr:hypothetical protein [Acetobacteraceae bacterium]
MTRRCQLSILTDMHHKDTTTAGLPPLPGPFLDRRGRPVPEGIAYVLTILHFLLAYGRHLSATLEQRATQRGFPLIARYFGTARVQFILARLSRGILRAMALERVLLARAARGRDLRARPPGECRKPRAKPPDTQGTAEAEQQKKARPAGRPDPDAALDLASLPSIEQLEAEIRRHPIGRALADICCDLGISSTLCDSRFGTVIYNAISWYRGNFGKYYQEIRKREAAFLDELDQDRSFRFDWPEQHPEAAHRFLGFWIGEGAAALFPVLDPWPPQAAADRPP